MTANTPPQARSVRLDKWLWAARFFKTRSLAKTAIENGRVRIAGQKLKAGKEIKTGMQLMVKQGKVEKTIDVLALSEHRGSASQAAKLYQETDSSIQNREQLELDRKAAFNGMPQTESKPNKKQRRQIMQFSRQSD
ncbi:MAG TPA: S4 domain-containing protein [Pseudomonadales bacterium]